MKEVNRVNSVNEVNESGRGKEEGRKKKGEEVRGRRVKSSIVYTLG